MFRSITTIKKVGLGFGLVTLILVAAVSLTLWQVAKMQIITHQLINQSAPMSDASLRVINGINYGVSQLRDWVLVANQDSKANRALAWSEWIEPSVTELNRLVEQSGSQTQKDQIQLVNEKLIDMKAFQEEVEAIARSDKNLPAHVLLLTEAGPKGEEILDAVAAMIEEESKLEATAERKRLLSQLAVFHSSFSRALFSIHAFVTSGKTQDRQQYQLVWQENVKAFDQIESQVNLFMGAESQQWSRQKGIRLEFEPLVRKILDIRESDQWNVAVAMLRDRGTPNARLVRATLEKFIADLEPQNKVSRDSLVSMTAFLTALEWGLLLTGVTLSVILATMIMRNIRASIADVQSTTQDVRTASQEISTGSQQQVTSLNQTATSLNEITTTAEEFKSTMQEFADRARAVQEAAKETARQSAEGRTLTQDSVERIEQVRINSQAAGESVLKLAEQMQRIGEITATVNEIADQTKLLALNASIEAARAGEDGRGFAVVATQVRELANQSKEAAGRIEGLISGTQKSMQDVVQKIESGSRLSEESTGIVRRMTTAFEEIALAIEQTTNAMGQINTGAKQQEVGISELVSSITEIDSASKESLASAEQTRKAILSIDERIKRLDQRMATF
ncbi:MAG: methyl-accepting chemotaxis protein [Planctomycetaceae bacterium]